MQQNTSHTSWWRKALAIIEELSRARAAAALTRAGNHEAAKNLYRNQP